ncbi:oxidoreductase [Leuconostoc litchii]|uniref:Nitroreductase family protein n=1 Tax=Leuconostoc litchii TaxID=1981069 RepID=A0A652NDX0_9LACO|nr:nitroreductase family protein [Leuconostoc litchii]TYC46470.1 nitroreductase family protein [Leuconostoc litchii]GMA70220.1 oxidoreductase [Leuconostoc litchii]
MANQDYITTIKQRRSIYALGKNVTDTKEEVTELIQSAIKETPSSFNNQTVRAAILFGKSSDSFWEIVAEKLKAEVPDEESYKATRQKIDSFKAGVGTILYFTDNDIVKQYQEQFALYAENFPAWAEQANGMAQINVWQALATKQIGASVQHYNPLVDEAVRATFNIPESWHLRAQMPFGSIEAAAGEKEYIADGNRFKIFE